MCHVIKCRRPLGRCYIAELLLLALLLLLLALLLLALLLLLLLALLLLLLLLALLLLPAAAACCCCYYAYYVSFLQSLLNTPRAHELFETGGSICPATKKIIFAVPSGYSLSAVASGYCRLQCPAFECHELLPEPVEFTTFVSTAGLRETGGATCPQPNTQPLATARSPFFSCSSHRPVDFLATGWPPPART
jgi:hypothetical protein